MKKNKKLQNVIIKLITFVFTLNLFINISNFNVKANEFLGFIYNMKEDNTIEICGYNGENDCIVIPKKINGKKVKSIGKEAFKEKSLKSVDIPDGVISIGEKAFYSSNLENINLPESIEFIGEYAFGKCAFSKIKLPSNITDIYNGTFYWCTNLKEVILPDKLKTIRTFAFNHCSLENIVLPDSLEVIGAGAFSYTKLKSIKIPENVHTIGITWNEKICTRFNAFVGCDKLVNVDVDEENKYYYDIDGILFSKGNLFSNWKVSIECYPIGKNDTLYIIPEEVLSIGSSAFVGTKNLKNLIIHSNLSEINGWNFEERNDLILYGEEGSYCETYCKSKNIRFATIKSFYGSRVKALESIPNDKYGIIVRDENGNNVNNAKVIIDDKMVNTNINGIAVFNNNFNFDQEHKITIECDGYYTYKEESLYINENNYKNICIYSKKTPPHKLSYAYYNEFGTIVENLYLKKWDILNSKKIIYQEEINPIKINFGVISDSATVKRSELWQGNKIIKSNGGIANIYLTTDEVKKIVPTDENNKLKIKIYDFEENCTTTDLNVEIYKNTMKKETSLELADIYDLFTVNTGSNESIPLILQNFKFNLKMPPLPISFAWYEDKYRVGINISDKMLGELKKNDNINLIKEFEKAFKSEKGEDTLKDVTNDKNKGNFLGADFKIVGYTEIKNLYSASPKKEMTLYFIGNKDFKEINKQFLLAEIPITVELKTNINVKSKVQGTYDVDTNKLNGNLGFNVTSYGDLFCGAGITKVAALGAYGRVTFELQVNRQSKLDVSGEVGVRGYIGPFKASKVLMSGKYNIYPNINNKLNSYSSLKSNSINESIYNLEEYKLIDRSYLSKQSNWFGVNDLENFQYSLKEADLNSNDNINLLIENSYNNSAPKVITSKENTIMVFVYDDGSRDDYNIGTLAYSVYDDESKTWSSLMKVDSNSTIDSSPYLYEKNNEIYLVYQDSSKVFYNNPSLEEYYKSLQVKVAKFNNKTKKFEDITSLKTGEKDYSINPKISIINETPIVTWISNNEGDCFGIKGENSISYSKFVNGKWADPIKLITGLNAITDINIGELNGKECIVYCEDKDNNLSTVDDRVLNSININGENMKLASGKISNPIFSVMPDSNTMELIWYDNENIKTTKDAKTIRNLFDSNIEELSDNFAIVGNKIMYCSKNYEENSNIYAISYDTNNKKWGDSIKVTNQDKYINDFSAVDLNGNILTVFTQNKVTITEQEVKEDSNLSWTIIKELNDVALNDVDYKFEDIVPNNNLPLSLSIENKGENTINKIIIEIKDGNNNILKNEEILVDILSGEEKKLNVDFLVPSKLDSYTITVYEKGKEDNNIEDNSFNFNIGYTDLSISTSQVKKGNKDCILAEVKNESYVNTSGTLNIYGTGSSEIPVATKKIDELKAGETKLYYIELGEEYFNDNKEGVVKVSVSSDKEEYYDSNNSDEEYVYYKHKITFVNDDKEYYVTDCMDSTALTSLPDAPIKNGKQFAGWYKDVNCTDGNEFDEKTIINDDITVYAKWIDKIEIGSFIADKASPQISGTTVKLSVKAKGNGILKYKFIIKDSKGNWYLLRDYGTSNTYNWTTGAIGDKTLYVDVKDENGQVVRKSMNYIVKEKILAPEISSFISDKASPQVSGTTVNLSVKAKGTGTLQYKFLIKDASGNWFVIQDYSSSNIAVWKASKTGNKTLYVDVKDSNGQVTRKSMSYTITAAAPTVTSFTADKKSSQASGIQLLLMAQATGEGELQYKFLVKDASGNWFVIQDYSSSNIAVWKASKTGNKTLYVDVKDSNGQVTRKSMSYTITAAAPTVTSFTADKKSSQASGIQLLLMAQATGEGELQYKFLVKDASGNWFVIQDYSSSNIAVWKASKTGNKTLYVDVKDSNGQVTRKSMNYIVK